MRFVVAGRRGRGTGGLSRIACLLIVSAKSSGEVEAKSVGRVVESVDRAESLLPRIISRVFSTRERPRFVAGELVFPVHLVPVCPLIS